MLDSYEGETLYTYDALGQLTSETKNACPGSDNGVTVNITYDNYGNILSKGNHTYGYDNVLWKDRLTSFDGQSITYDAQGNPTNYLGHNLTWEKGRQLKSFDNIQYSYNANGIRISKTVDNVRHDYVVDGGRILKETWQDNTLIPIYNNNQEVVGIYYNCEPYYFFKNLQGDVIGISDVDGRAVVAYTYDAWGVCSVLHDHTDFGLANINPYRYRSYYYDAEIGMYYLQSRYYDPLVGRFLNSDDPMLLGMSGSALSYNLWTYCYNSSVNFSDSTGTSPIQVVLAALFGVIGFAIADCIARGLGLFPSGKGFWNSTMYWALTGAIAVGGAILGWYAGAAITKMVVAYISKNPSIIIKIANKCGGSLFTTIMYFLGINPLDYVSNASQLTALARALNSSWFALPKSWAQAFCDLADKLGRKLFFDTPHGRYGYHIHLGGQNGQRLEGIHIQVVKAVWDFLKNLFGR